MRSLTCLAIGVLWASCGESLEGATGAGLLTREAVQRLQAPAGAERREALRILNEEREAAVQGMLALLRSHVQETSGLEDGTAHVIVQALCKWRAQEAADVLIRMITYKVVFQAGAKRPLGSEYVCAHALVNIGGRAVLDAVAKALRSDGPEDGKLLLTWVVSRLVGAEGGSAFLLASADKALPQHASKLKWAAAQILLGDRLMSVVVQGQATRRGPDEPSP